MEDTIVAIGTALGESALAIVRLSGGGSIFIADKVFKGKKRVTEMKSHVVQYGFIINPQTHEKIDEVLLTVMKAPNSYTREDMVEISCHGGFISPKRILSIFLLEGARLAEPGEFTKRAFLNGRIDLSQVEAVCEVIRARTERVHSLAMEQLRGRTKDKIKDIKEQVIDILTDIEAVLDFPEEDFGEISRGEIIQKCQNVLKILEEMLNASMSGDFIKEGVKVAIVGKPNVGKSSLFNTILQEEKAIVTEIPGTTRDVLEGWVEIHGIPILLMDSAGMREAKDIIERKGVNRTEELIKKADLILLLFDSSEQATKEDELLFSKVKEKNHIVILNKIDLPKKFRSFFEQRPIEISATNVIGIERLKDEIRKKITESRVLSGESLLLNIRQEEALKKGLSFLNSGIKALKNNLSYDFISVDIRQALISIGEISGETTGEEILNRIFEKFCIGK